MKTLGWLLLLPFRIAAWLIVALGRTVAVVLGLVLLGLGAVLCYIPPLALIGAPLCLISAIVVIKALE